MIKISQYWKYKEEIIKEFGNAFFDKTFNFVHITFQYYKNYACFTFLSEPLSKANMNIEIKPKDKEYRIGQKIYFYIRSADETEFDNCVLFVFEMYSKIFNQIIDTYNFKKNKLDPANERLREQIINFDGKYNKRYYFLTVLFKKIGLLDEEFNFKTCRTSLKLHFLNDLELDNSENF